MALLSCVAVNFKASGTSYRSFIKSIQHSSTIHLFQYSACFITPRKQSRKSAAFLFRPDTNWIPFGIPVADMFLNLKVQGIQFGTGIDSVAGCPSAIVGMNEQKWWSVVVQCGPRYVIYVRAILKKPENIWVMMMSQLKILRFQHVVAGLSTGATTAERHVFAIWPKL